MLQGFGDTIMRAQALSQELAKEREYSSQLPMKYDGQAVEYHNTVQQLEEGKDRLQKRNKALKHQLKGNWSSPVSF